MTSDLPKCPLSALSTQTEEALGMNLQLATAKATVDALATVCEVSDLLVGVEQSATDGLFDDLKETLFTPGGLKMLAAKVPSVEIELEQVGISMTLVESVSSDQCPLYTLSVMQPPTGVYDPQTGISTYTAQNVAVGNGCDFCGTGAGEDLGGFSKCTPVQQGGEVEMFVKSNWDTVISCWKRSGLE